MSMNKKEAKKIVTKASKTCVTAKNVISMVKARLNTPSVADVRLIARYINQARTQLDKAEAMLFVVTCGIGLGD